MSKVKHLLRKLHIGGGINEHQRLGEAPQPVISPSPNPTPTAPSPGSSSGSVSGAMGGIGAVESVRGDRAAGDGVDFNFLEEEFQVQLALAISASDPDTRQDPEKAQIDAAKRISLICPPSVTDTDALVEFLSLRYWNYKVISYEEKVVDGFYDVYGITSHSLAQGKMPLLVDLQAISFADSIDYEVILVNRLADRELQELEKRAYAVSMECHGLVSSGLIQKLADIVVNKMGGPVGDADEILRRWTLRSYELRNSLNTIILPLGCIDVGLSRHRALLFKVLADRINLPCMLVKGSYYTGTDDGAVNLIKINNGSEYIVDLMGAPGTLIPAEVPSSHLPNSGFNIRGFANHLDTSQGSCLVPDKGIGTKRVSPSLDGVLDIGSSKSDEAIYGTHPNEFDRNIGEKNQTERFEHDFGELIQSLHKSGASSLGISGKPSSAQKSAQKMKVKNVSKYVISAAKDPEFAQKLHAVLLESGASPPPDLFLDINSSALGDRNMLEQAYEAHRNDVNRLSSNHEQSFVSSVGIESSNSDIFDTKQKQAAERVAEHRRKFETNVMKEPASPSRAESEGLVNAVNESTLTESTGVDKVSGNPHGLVARPLHGRQIYDSSFPSAAEYCQRQLETTFLINDRLVGNNSDLSKESVGDFLDANSSQSLACSGHNEMINPLLREVAEWEIPWEDLQIGERIGIGSYGEVYLAEWNGTEVAVKKFLDQDFSGDALVQFKSEVEIMLRLSRESSIVFFLSAMAFALSLMNSKAFQCSPSYTSCSKQLLLSSKPAKLFFTRHLPSHSVLAFARPPNKNAALRSSSNKKKKNKKGLASYNKNEGEENLDDDPFEALFSQLEEDLKNDNSSMDDDGDEINEEDIEALARELEEALGDDGDLGMFNLAAESDNDEAHDDDGDNNEESEEDDIPVKLKNWQLKRLAYALKSGRRKTSIKSLAAELCLDRALVLELLRDPPPNLLMMSAALSDKPAPMMLVPETNPSDRIIAESTVDSVKPDTNKKEPIHVMQHRWSAQKRLKKMQVETLERVYRRSKRPTNAMISSIVQVTNLPRKRIVKWFEDKRAEDGIPERHLPYQRRQGSSGLVWEDRYELAEDGKVEYRDKLRPCQSTRDRPSSCALLTSCPRSLSTPGMNPSHLDVFPEHQVPVPKSKSAEKQAINMFFTVFSPGQNA